MTAQNLHIKIYSNLLDEIEKLVQILSKDSDIKEIDEYRLEALSKLEGIIKEVKENIDSAGNRTGGIQAVKIVCHITGKGNSLLLGSLCNLISCGVHDHTWMIIILVNHVF